MHTGKGSPFRSRSRLEMMASKVGRLAPDGLRSRLRGTYEFVLQRVRPGSLVCTMPGGERVRLLPSLRRATWNPDEYDEFRRVVRPGAVVFDVGANVGSYTVLFAQWAGASGRVFAFEPAPQAFECLTRLLDVNGISSRVAAVNAAVSSREGSAAFVAAGADGANRLAAGTAGPHVVNVTTTTIDAVCRREGVVPDVIKIDVEGAELDVLRASRAAIAAAGPALKLYVEMHPHLWPEFQATRADIEAELQQQGLRAERLDGDPAIWNIEGVCLRLVPCGS